MKVIQTSINKIRNYLIFKVDTLRIDEKLLFDIYIKRDKDFVIIIEAGTLITEKLYDKLKKQKSLYVYKHEAEKNKLSCQTLIHHLSINKDNIQNNLSSLYIINKKIFQNYLESEDNKISNICVEELVTSILFLIDSYDDFLKKIMAFFVNEHELETHSLNVCIYSMSIGRALNVDDTRLVQLGTAALLHDVGIKKIDPKIIEKEQSLSVLELEHVQQHPLLSVEIIKHNKITDPYIIDAVTHHHENYDGSGYPNGLIQRQISIFASIISIADVFDALTNTRPNREAYNSFAALKIMMQDEKMVNKFNHKYLQVFLTLL